MRRSTSVLTWTHFFVFILTRPLLSIRRRRVTFHSGDSIMNPTRASRRPGHPGKAQTMFLVAMFVRTFPVALGLALALGLTCATSVRAVEFDFDTTGPTTTAEVPNFFDLLGNAVNDVHIDANTVNPANGSNALHMSTDGGGGELYFNRTAILKASVFSAEDLVYSADITWDDDNDEAGLYFRFDGNSNDPLGNSYYNLHIDQGDNDLKLTRVKNGADVELFNMDVSATAVATRTGTINMRVEATGGSISVFLNDIAVPGASPFIDPDPIVGQATNRVGVGTWSQRAYYDNLSAVDLIPEPSTFLLAALGLLGLLGYGRRRRRT